MNYQIDQSGKIEQTERHTVLACTNNTNMTILLKKREKRKLQGIFKVVESQKVFPYLTFAALLAILINKLKPKHKIIIDREYIGHEDFIEEKVTLYLEQLNVATLPQIKFGHVGKLSTAHTLAYQVAVGKKEPDIVVGAKEIAQIIFGTKKDRDRLTQE